jgi:hypothetical protein
MARTIFIAAALAFAVTLPAVPAQAQANRTFVSAAGSDSNNCANVISPCRHFAAAYAVTAPSGEIFVLDPANYGSLTITHAVSIEGHGWASIAPPNGGNAITINAGSSDSISIHGVSIDGTGATGGTNGIVFNSGGGLVVSDCVVQNFTNNNNSVTGIGIFIQPSSGFVKFAITDTILANNGWDGFSYEPLNGQAAASGFFERVAATNNAHNGITLKTTNTTAQTWVSIANSTANNNGLEGIALATGGVLAASIDNVAANSNSDGIVATGSSVTVNLGRSVITANQQNGIFFTGPNTIFSYGNNSINGNATWGSGADLISAMNTTHVLR